MSPGEPNAREIERYLHEHIPLSRAMGVSVREVTNERVLLGAPLAPNINHRETVFGGSAAALAMLACWTLLRVRLQAATIDARVVVRRGELDFQEPLAGEFEALCELEEPASWQAFERILRRRGRARIGLSAMLMHAARPCVSFRGEFAAIRNPAGPRDRA